MISIGILLGVTIDWLAGEPRRYHPLVGFGRLAAALETTGNAQHPERRSPPRSRMWQARLCGGVAVMILCLPLPVICHYGLLSTALPAEIRILIEAVMLYLTLGHRSLWEHIKPITSALERQDEPLARQHCSMIVSRDPEALNIEVSAIESVLENGSDAIFGAIFWFVVAGAPGAICYRLVNTLDAMWGYRSERYRDFGWAAAKLDDLLNYLPARCTAVSYALLSHPANALRCWRTQAAAHASPNGGPVIAAGAGGLGVLLGGPTRYQGVWHNKPLLGCGLPPTTADIQRALRLVSHTLLLWIGLLIAAELLGLLLI